MHAESSVGSAFRTAVRANAVFCGVSGVLIAVFAESLAALMGAGPPGFYLVLGILLAVYAVHLAVTSRREGLGRGEAVLIVIGDVVWVVASVAVVATGILTPAGVAGVLVVAAVVGGFALWQWRALRGAVRGPVPTEGEGRPLA